MCLVKSPWGEGKAVISSVCLQTLKRDKRTPWGEDLLAVISSWAGIGHLFWVPSTATLHRGTDRQGQALSSLSWEVTESTTRFICPRTGTLKLLSHHSLSQPLGGCRAVVGAETGAQYPWSIPGESLGFPHPVNYCTKIINHKLLQSSLLPATTLCTILNAGLHVLLQAAEEGRLRKPRTFVSCEHHYQTHWAWCCCLGWERAW